MNVIRGQEIPGRAPSEKKRRGGGTIFYKTYMRRVEREAGGVVVSNIKLYLYI